MRKLIKSAVASPCISVCTMDDDSGYCLGCLRTLKEISEWESYSDAQKNDVIALLPSRSNKKP